MPKKTASARGGAQRNKPRVQKSIELVRPTSSQVAVEQEVEAESASDTELTEAAVDASTEVSTESIETDSSSTLVAPEVKKSKSTSASTMIAPTARKRERTGTKVLAETDAVESVSKSTSAD